MIRKCICVVFYWHIIICRNADATPTAETKRRTKITPLRPIPIPPLTAKREKSSSSSSNEILPASPTVTVSRFHREKKEKLRVKFSTHATTHSYDGTQQPSDRSPNDMLAYYRNAILPPRLHPSNRNNIYPPMGISPTLVKPDSIDLKLALTSFVNLQMVRLKELESMWIVSEKKKAAFVKINNDSEAVLLVHPDFKDQAENLSYIAASINDGSIAVRNEKGLVKKVSIKFAKTKTQFQEKAREIEDAKSLLRPGTTRTFKLMCYCNTPSVSESHSQSIGNGFLKQKCKCGEALHNKCVTEKGQRAINRSGFTCAPCIVKNVTKGVQWSAPSVGGRNINNTCPIDNSLTGLSIFMPLQSPDLESYMPNTPYHEQLMETLALVQEGRSNEAQVKFYDDLNDYLKTLKPKRRPFELEKDNLFGNATRVFHTKHKEGLEFKLKTTCHDDTCGNEVTTKDSDIALGYYLNDPSQPQGLRSITELDKVFNGFKRKCKKCKTADATVRKIEVSENQWGIIFDGEALNEEAHEKLKHEILSGKLPDSITVKKGYKFGLSSVILNDSHSHYVAAHWVPQERAFVFYDGMKQQSERIRKLHHSDLFQTNRGISGLEYYRIK